jgi:hypothetical protein
MQAHNIAYAQQPAAYALGMGAGSLAAPSLGLLKGGTLAARAGYGALSGAAGSGLAGGASALSEGATPQQAAMRALASGAAGGALGGIAPGAGALARPALGAVAQVAEKFSPAAAATLAMERLVNGDVHSAMMALGGGAAGWTAGKAAAGLQQLLDMLGKSAAQRLVTPAQRLGTRAAVRNVGLGTGTSLTPQTEGAAP